VEVVFQFNADADTDFGTAGDKYHTRAGDRGSELRFSLSEGEYRGIMFLGTVEEMQLLAVGVVTGLKQSDGSPSAGTVSANGEFTVTPDLRTIEFTVSPLTADIAPVDGSGVFQGGGAFELEGPNLPIDYATSKPKDATKLVSGSGEKIPYFTIPKGVDEDYGETDVVETSKLIAIQGKFTYSGFPTALAAADVDLATDTAMTGWLGLDATDQSKMILTTGVAAHDSVLGLNLAPVKVTGEIETATLTTTGKLELAFVLATGAKDGLAKIQFFAPGVKAFKYGEGTGERGSAWRIAGGFNSGAFDVGGDSTGQNILLLVGDQELGGGSYIIVNSEFTP
jgi:hypothetical protein